MNDRVYWVPSDGDTPTLDELAAASPGLLIAEPIELPLAAPRTVTVHITADTSRFQAAIAEFSRTLTQLLDKFDRLDPATRRRILRLANQANTYVGRIIASQRRRRHR